MGIKKSMESSISFLTKNNHKIEDIRYGYSLFNITTNRLHARVYYANNEKEWIKTDIDNNVVEFYREFKFEIKSGIVSMAYDLNTFTPIEYYRDTEERGFRERVKFDFFTNEELARDMFLDAIFTLVDLKPHINVKIYPDLLNFNNQYEITYYSNKPYGHIVGFDEENPNDKSRIYTSS